MPELNIRFGKKFAAGDSVFISLGCVASDIDVSGNFLKILTFNDCADHIRAEVCDALNADSTFLGKNGT